MLRDLEGQQEELSIFTDVLRLQRVIEGHKVQSLVLEGQDLLSNTPAAFNPDRHGQPDWMK